MAIIEMTRAEYEKKYGGVAPQAGQTPTTSVSTESELPLLTNQQGGFGTALKDVGVGFGKELMGTSRGVAQTLQSIGKGTLGMLGADTSQMGFKSLEDKQIDEQLKAKSRGEQVGKVLGFGAEVGAGFIKSAPAVKGAIEARRGAQAVKAATPEVKALTPTRYQSALGKGQIKPGGLLTPEKYVLPEAEKATAIKYSKLLKSKDPIKNSQSILKEISKQDEAVGKFLEQNKGIFSKGELRNHILERLKDVDDVAIAPERIAKLKETLTDGFIRNLKKNDMAELWKARKMFDTSIKKVFSGSPTLQNTVKREFRNAIQDFISTKTPDTFYSGAMKEMSNLFRIHDNVALQAAREKGMSGLRVLMRRHPVATKIIGGTIGYKVAQSLGILPGEQ
jgi:hypothetical protein